MNSIIREIKESDFPQLILLLKEFATFQKTPERMLNTTERMKSEMTYLKGFVVESNNQIVAYVTYNIVYYTWSGKSLYMDDLYVKPEYRGAGFGNKLIQSVIDFGKAENCHKLKWQVSEWNKPAIDFYKSLGAEIDSTESNCVLSLI